MSELISGLVFVLFAGVIYYAVVIKEALLRKRCTWDVEAEILRKIRKKHVSHDSDHGTSVSYTMETLCGYYYRGIYYEEKVSFSEPFFNRNAREDKIRFKIDPNSPKTIYVDEGFYKLKTIFLTCFLGIFFLVGIGGLWTGVEGLISKYNKSYRNEVSASKDNIKDDIKDVEISENSTEDEGIDKDYDFDDENKQGDILDGKQEEQIKYGDNSNKNKLDAPETFLNNSIQQKVFGISISVPKNMYVSKRGKDFLTYKDKENNDALSIKVVNHSVDDKTAMRQLQDYVWEKYSPTYKEETYRFNNNLWLIYTVVEKNNTYKIVAASANDNKKMVVVFKNGKGSNTDMRDILGGIVY